MDFPLVNTGVLYCESQKKAEKCATMSMPVGLVNSHFVGEGY